MGRHGNSAGWSRRAARRARKLRQQVGVWLCRTGFHSLRPVPGTTVDDNFCHEEQCRRCGKIYKIPYAGV